MTFLGREPELAVVDAAIACLAGGDGQVLLLAGEAGVGKSTLLQQIAERAAGAPARVLWGRCSEEPGAPLFWPWIQLLRAWLRGRDISVLSAASPEHGATAAELLSPQGGRTGSLTGSLDADGIDQSRFLFLHAVAGFWADAAAQEPLVLILDDLHRDYGASLKLMTGVGEMAARVPLFLVAAYRSEEVKVGHPLRDSLAALLGRTNVRHLSVDGLSMQESERLIAALTGSDPPPGIRRAIAMRSDGNPLFIRELSRDLARGGVGEAQETPGDTRAPVLPESIRLLFEQRLGRLTVTAREVLQAAAVIGRRFDLTTVAAALESRQSIDIQRGLEEAFAERMVNESAESGRYQFTHELLRETIYADTPSTRRMALHGAVAREIESRHSANLDIYLARLAHHFSQAGSSDASAKAVQYHARAARQAAKLHSHEEAAEHYREALRLDMAAGGVESPELLPALGEMEVLAGSSEAAELTFQRALDLARSAGDARLLARAILGLEYATWRIGRDERHLLPQIREALSSAQTLDQRTVIDLYSTLCRASALAGEPDEAMKAYREAVAAARALGEPHALFQSLRALVTTRFWPSFLTARIEASREGLAIAQANGRIDWAISGTTAFLFLDLVEAGAMDEARRVGDVHREGARLVGDRFCQLVGEHLRIMLAMLDRADATIEAQITGALQVGLRWGPPANAHGVHGIQMFTLRRLQGRLGELRPVLQQYLSQNDLGATWAPALTLVYCELGMLPEARSVFDRIARGGFASIARDARWGISMSYLAEACAALGDRKHAAELYERLHPYAGLNIVAITVCLGPADRLLGLLATTRGDWETAVSHLETARTLAANWEQPIWKAFVEADLAAALIARGAAADYVGVRELLRTAASVASELGLASLGERCISLMSRLPGGTPRSSYPDGLTQGEIKVLRLLAAGATNKAIGRELSLSPHTVAAHVRNILGKSGNSNRTEAANYARRHGLVSDASFNAGEAT